MSAALHQHQAATKAVQLATASSAAPATVKRSQAPGVCACGGGCPRCGGVKAADPPTATGGTAPTPAAGGGTASPADVPKFLGGELAIKQNGDTVVTVNDSSMAHLRFYHVDSPFTVSTSGVKIEEPTTSLFEYGLVQNLFFHHMEARYDPSGDLLADAVGPMLDVFPGEKIPFFHEGNNNPMLASAGVFGSSIGVSVSYTDKPGMPLPWQETACNRRVSLKSAKNSVQFRTGLVARNVRNPAQFVQMASTTSTFGLWWELSVDKPGDSMAFHITTSPMMKGPLTLSSSAPPVVLDGTLAVTDINSTLDIEKKDLTTRCESVLDPPREPLP